MRNGSQLNIQINKMTLNSKSRLFCPVFKWSGSWSNVRFSNGVFPFEIRTFSSGFQMVFEIRTICQPDTYSPFENRTSPDFGGLLNFLLFDFSWMRSLTPYLIYRMTCSLKKFRLLMERWLTHKISGNR